MKKAISIMSVFALLFIAIPAFAANNTGVNQGMGTQQKEQSSFSSNGSQVQNENQVRTQNEGEDTRIQTNTREQESLSGSQEAQDKETPKETSPRSETAVQHMSNVALKVEGLLTAGMTEGGIGQQVRAIAQEQKTAQEQLQTDLKKVDSRGGLLKAVIGPDFKALKNMQMQMEQNRVRIQQLTQLQNQLTNQGDITQVQETVQALTDQNTALQDRISLEEQSGGLLGWFFKLFAR